MNAFTILPSTITERALAYAADHTIQVYGKLLTQPDEAKVEVTLYVEYDDIREDDDYGRSFINRTAVAIGGLWFDDDGAMIGPFDRDGLYALFGVPTVIRWEAEAVA